MTNSSENLRDDPEFNRRAFLYLEGCITPEDLSTFSDELRIEPAKRQLLVGICLTRTGLTEAVRMAHARNAEGHQRPQEAGAAGPQADRAEVPAVDLEWNSFLQLLERAGNAATGRPSIAPMPAAAERRASGPSRDVFSAVSPHRAAPPRLWRIAAAVAIPLLLGLIVWQLRPSSSELSTIAAAIDAQMDGQSAGLSPKTKLATGRHTLSKGLLQLKLAGGATVVLEGPAQFEVLSNSAVCLTTGRLSAAVRHNSAGLRVQTPDAVAVDLGTEFGVAVDAGKSTHVEVFQGLVRVEVRSKDGGLTEQNVSAQQAVAVLTGNADIQPTSTTPLAFARSEEVAERAQPQGDSGYRRWRQFSDQLRRDPALVAYYPFDHEDQGSQRVANRAVAGLGRYDGVFDAVPSLGSPVWTTGRWPEKAALQFGTNGPAAFSIPTGGNLISTDALTIAFWIKRSETSRTIHLIRLTTDLSTIVFDLSVTGSEGERLFKPLTVTLYPDWTGNDSEIASPPILSADQQWCFVAVTALQDGQTEFYVNGVLRNTCPSGRLATGSGAATLTIGAPYPPSEDYLHGWMDELAVFHRVLSSAEIRRMYDAGAPGQ